MREIKIAILLATYNGAKYIAELLDSLVCQSIKGWQLYIQDDGSTDGTVEIIERYAATDPRITICDDGLRHRGALQNFMSLLYQCQADYYFFCDQDDVWLKKKIEVTLQRMTEEEQQYPQLPIIIHTDLTVTDANLHPIQPSFWKMAQIAPELLRSFSEIAGHNLVTGCTMMINSKAKDLAFPYHHAIMHDAWITAKVLQAGGRVTEIAQSTIFYRQHENNTIGASDKRHHYLRDRIFHLKNVLKENIHYYRMLHAAGYNSLIKYVYYKLRYYKAYRRLFQQH